MKIVRIAPLLVLLVSCRTHPSAPSLGAGATVSLPIEGSVGVESIGVERLRLRRTDGTSIVTELASGQVIDVPTNEAINIWAEISRLENDRARLVVDWGDSTDEFAGCGSCRVDHVYQREGRYEVFARVLDLNAPAGSNVIVAVRLTLVAKENRVVRCVDSDISFSEFADNTPLPIASGGAWFSGNGRVSFLFNAFAPELELQAIEVNGQGLVIEYSSDHTSFSAGVLTLTGNSAPFSYRALDAEGTIVSAGPVAPSIVLGGGSHIKGSLQFTSEPYRRIVLTPPTGIVLYLWIDNLVASCR